MNLVSRTKPIVIDSWRKCNMILPHLKVGDIITIKTKTSFLENFFLLSIKRIAPNSHSAVWITVTNNNGSIIQELILTTNSFKKKIGNYILRKKSPNY